MSIFQHITNPIFDKVPGDNSKGVSSINPKTGKREYFLAAAMQAAPAIMSMLTAPPPTGMKGVQGSLTSSIGGMMGGLNPSSNDEDDKKVTDYERGLKARYVNSNPDLINQFSNVGIKPENGKFNGADVRRMELTGYLAPKKDTITNENMRDAWAQTKEGQRYYNSIQQNMQNQPQQEQQYVEPAMYEQQQYEPQYQPQYEQQPQQPQFLVPDNTVHQRISGVMNRAPDIVDRLHQEINDGYQGQY